MDGNGHLGAAFQLPVTGTLLAVQADIYDDFDVAYYRLGIEQSLLVLKLRGGAMLNEEFDAVRYTAGLGFKLGPVVFDVAAVAPDHVGSVSARKESPHQWRILHCGSHFRIAHEEGPSCR